MVPKKRHKLLGITVLIGILMLSIPLFFQDIEIMPYFWFTHALPPTPHNPSIPTADPFPIPKLYENKIKKKEIFVVQIKNLNTMEEAKALVEKLKKENFNAFLPLKSHNVVVYIGPELHYKEALSILNQLQLSLRQNATIEIYRPS